VERGRPMVAIQSDAAYRLGGAHLFSPADPQGDLHALRLVLARSRGGDIQEGGEGCVSEDVVASKKVTVSDAIADQGSRLIPRAYIA
jgi:hypothetical protein